MNDKKVIAVYVDTMNKSGGRERVIANLINRWVDDYEIVLITKDEGISFYQIAENVTTISLKLCMNYEMNRARIARIIAIIQNIRKSVKVLKKVLKTLTYDYLYVSTPQNAFEAYKAMKCPERKLVISEHAYVNAFNKPYMLMKHYIYPKAYCISVPNSSDTEEYMKWKCNAVYIPHLVTFMAEEKNELKNRIAISIGRLTDDKQQDKLIDIWSNVGREFGWELWIVGDGENKEQLQKQIDKLECKDVVKLLPARKDIQNVYKQASLFVFTSRWEGFGMVLLEAMSFGIPCISFDCPSGPRDIIKDGVNGILVENGDVNAFQEKLKEFFEIDSNEITQFGKSAFDTVRNWDNEGIMAEWDKIFS